MSYNVLQSFFWQLAGDLRVKFFKETRYQTERTDTTGRKFFEMSIKNTANV